VQSFEKAKFMEILAVSGKALKVENSPKSHNLFLPFLVTANKQINGNRNFTA